MSAASTASASASAAPLGKWDQMDSVVQMMVLRLKRRELRGSSQCALHTAETLRTVITKHSFKDVQEMLDLLKAIGRALIAANPMELSIGNTVRRVLFIIRQEAAALDTGAADGADKQLNVDMVISLHNLLDEKSHEINFSRMEGASKIKQPIIEGIGELIDEIKSSYQNISEQAVEHIHAKEVIMTFGTSRTVTAFFKEAAKLRKFEVVVAESAPSFSGQHMAQQLAEAGIECTVITDSAVFAMMAAVNKVIIGTHAVMANGGLIAHSGAHNIAVAAKTHSVPLVVVTGLYKLCPLYAFDQDTFNELGPPSDVLRFEEEYVDKVDVKNPSFDYIPPDLVSLFVTNEGGHNPSYVYRLLAEYYNPEDYEL